MTVPSPAERAWPSQDRTAQPPDLTGSWGAWAGAAESAGEAGLALALLSSMPGRADSLVVAAGRARSLVILGRPAEAIALLGSAGVRPATGAHPGSIGELVLGAAHAATGDQAAYRWFRSALADLSDALREEMRPVLRAVADQVHDLPVADAEAIALLGVHGRSHPATFVRAASGELAGLPQQTPPGDLAGIVLLMAQSAGSLGATVTADPAHVDPGRDPRYLIALVRALVARGAGVRARLLLEAYCRLHAPHPELAAVRREVEPSSLGRRLGVVLGMLAAVAVGVGAALAVGRWEVALVVSVLALVGAAELWSRRPGFTLSERRAWAVLRRNEYDSDAHTWRGPDIGGRLATAVVVLVLGIGLAGFVGGKGVGLARAVGADTWGLGDGTLLLAGAAFPATTALVALGLRALLRSRRRAAARAAETSSLRELMDHSRTCRCLDLLWLRGRSAAAYAQVHLRPEDDADATSRAAALGGTLPDTAGARPVATLLRCPDTQLAWLFGPLAQDGLLVALRGTTPTRPAAAGADEPGIGLYL